jgi:hypothetical protein
VRRRPRPLSIAAVQWRRLSWVVGKCDTRHAPGINGNENDKITLAGPDDFSRLSDVFMCTAATSNNASE